MSDQEPNPEQQEAEVPRWAEAKAKKPLDVLREVSSTLAETDRVRANQPVVDMTERDLEAEQLRLEAMLNDGLLTVEAFRRLREIDFFLEGMRKRRHYGAAHEGWKHERMGDE